MLDQLEHCRARRQVLILDSCFSGAFALGAKGDAGLDLRNRFLGSGRGRAVLTASAATEYSFEGEPTGAVPLAGSVFTAALVHGLRTGAADTDHDGHVSVDDAYAYVFDQVQAVGAAQTPQRWLYGGEGTILLARSPAGPAILPTGIQTNALREEQHARDIATARHRRASALLDAAESTAASIKSKRLRARALAEIASGLAIIDFSRSAGLTGEAERVARNVNHDAGKARALSGVAEALAATDPDRATGLAGEAERIIKGFIGADANAAPMTSTDIMIALAFEPPGSESTRDVLRDMSSRAMAEEVQREVYAARIGIADALGVLAASDPDRAERTAAGLADKFLKARALAGIAASLAATDPDRAEQLAAGISGKFSYERTWALAGIAASLAAADPDRTARTLDEAEHAAAGIKHNFRKGPVLARIATAQAAIDPDRAERTAAGITREDSKGEALAGIASVLAATDPDRANRVTAGITSKFWKVSALAKIARALELADADRAIQIWEEAGNIAHSITDETAKVRALAKIASAHPERADQTWDDAERIARGIADVYTRTRMLTELAKSCLHAGQASAHAQDGSQ